MNTTTKCTQCGSENVTPGTLMAEAHTRFRPMKMKLLTMSTGAHVAVVACLDCGALGLWTDPEEVKSIMKDGEGN
jgi:predicted nucleic-acid-binding Zn-ribbon protein